MKILKIFRRLLITLSILVGMLLLYSSALIGVEPEAKESLHLLKKQLQEDGYKPRVYVISGRRFKPDNWLLTKISGAASNSQHLQGNAIDILVFDVNQDGTSDKKDVNLVYDILNKQLLKGKGGLGTYKKEKSFFSQQMIHFDIRPKKARWNR